MDDARHGAPRRRLHGQHRPAGPLRGERLLQMGAPGAPPARASGRPPASRRRRAAGEGSPSSAEAVSSRPPRGSSARRARPRRGAAAPTSGRATASASRGAIPSSSPPPRALEPHAERREHRQQLRRVEHRPADREGDVLADVARRRPAPTAPVAQQHRLFGLGARGRPPSSGRATAPGRAPAPSRRRRRSSPRAARAPRTTRAARRSWGPSRTTNAQCGRGGRPRMPT